MTRFEVRRILTSSNAMLAFGVLFVIQMAGLVFELTHMVEPSRGRFGPLAFLAAALIALRSNASADRELGFDRFAAINLGSAGAYVRAKIAALVAIHVALCAGALLIGLIALYDRPHDALWNAGMFLLLGWFLLPLILVIEVSGRMRMPAPVAAIIFFVSVIATGISEREGLLGILGLARAPGEFAGLHRLFMIDLVVVPAAFLVIYLVWKRSLTPRLNVTSAPDPAT